MAGRRTIALAPIALGRLTAHRKRQAAERLAAEYWDDNGWMFPDEWGRPMDPQLDYRAWRRLCEDAGIPVRRLHDLRHTAATLLLEAEVDLKSAGQVLGHGTVSQTAAYTHVTRRPKGGGRTGRRSTRFRPIRSVLTGVAAGPMLRLDTHALHFTNDSRAKCKGTTDSVALCVQKCS